MAAVSTHTHGIIDYAIAAGLIAVPAVARYPAASSAAAFTSAMGAAAAAYSLFTDYEFGVLRLIPMPAHLGTDAIWTATLALGPWVVGFSRRGTRYWVPQLLIALVAAAVIASSDTQSRHDIRDVPSV